jgi:hypothetical protein
LRNNPELGYDIFHEHTKHIEVDCDSIREVVDTKVIYLLHISADLRIINVLTKLRTRQHHQFLFGKVMFLNHSTSI